MPRTIHGEAPRSALRARVVSLPARELLPPGPPPTWAPARRPGCTPRARRSGVLEHLVGDVEVGVHLLHVVELLAVSAEGGANLRPRAVAVVGGGLGHDRDAARRVALVQDALEGHGLTAAGRLLDRPLDVLPGHVHAARALDREPEPEVRFRVAAALFGGKQDFLGHLRENDPALDVGGAFLALDLAPL